MDIHYRQHAGRYNAADWLNGHNGLAECQSDQGQRGADSCALVGNSAMVFWGLL